MLYSVLALNNFSNRIESQANDRSDDSRQIVELQFVASDFEVNAE